MSHYVTLSFHGYIGLIKFHMNVDALFLCTSRPFFERGIGLCEQQAEESYQVDGGAALPIGMLHWWW
jgi:hypothetical protein